MCLINLHKEQLPTLFVLLLIIACLVGLGLWCWCTKRRKEAALNEMEDKLRKMKSVNSRKLLALQLHGTDTIAGGPQRKPCSYYLSFASDGCFHGDGFEQDGEDNVSDMQGKTVDGKLSWKVGDPQGEIRFREMRDYGRMRCQMVGTLSESCGIYTLRVDYMLQKKDVLPTFWYGFICVSGRPLGRGTTAMRQVAMSHPCAVSWDSWPTRAMTQPPAGAMAQVPTFEMAPFLQS